VADSDRQFLLSVFLMEAWDTLAAVEEGLATLRHAPDETAMIEHLAVVTHRLRGSAALSGFPQVAGLAAAMEETVDRVGATPATGDRPALDALTEMAGWLKTALDVIGETGVEDGEAIARWLAGPTPPEPPAPDTPEPPATHVPDDDTSRRLADLDRFFSQQTDVLEYFVPEAIEHLEVMAQSLIALEGEGSTESEIAELFRAVHTLKGAAYTVGCGMIGDLAHRVEDMLGEIRERRRPLDRVAIETIFAGLDALRLLVRTGEDRADTRAAAYDRAIGLLDTLPAIAAAQTLVAPEPGVEDTVAPEAVAAVSQFAAVTETLQHLDPLGAAEHVMAPVDQVAAPIEHAAPVEQVTRPTEPVTRSLERGRPSRDAAARRQRPSIRVSLDRLDALMNLVGELVITRSRLERHLAQLEQAGELLSFTQSRMTQTVAEFESKYADRMVPPLRAEGGGSPEPAVSSPGEFFDELEFDRYDDFNLLARRVGEISSDLTEIQHEVTGLVRIVREDAGSVQRLSGELRGQITRARMVPVGRLFAPFVRMVRDGSRAAGKSVVLEVRGETVEMDTTIVELMADPLIHLVRNAIAHGIEPEDARQREGKPAQGTIHLGAAHKGGSIYIEVADDGRGIDVEAVGEAARRSGFVTAETLARLGEREILDLIFLPGVTTSTSVTTAAGRGVGMDVVRANVSRLGGEIEVQTEAGRGTRFRIRLPLTVAISDALIVNVGAQTLAIPVAAVKQAISARPENVRTVDGVESVEIEGEPVDLVRLDRVLRIAAREPGGSLSIVNLRTGRKTLAVVVDEFLNKEEIVIKSLGAFLQGIGPFSGATVTGEGRVILLLDALKLLEMSATAVRPGVADLRREPAAVAAADAESKRRVLLVDDSVSVRKFVGGMLERAGFHVVAARNGAEALQLLTEQSVDVVVTDLEMPRLNGYELIRDLHRERSTRNVPVVVLTTRAGAKHVDLARGLGVEHYVAKPVDETSFVQLIESLAATPATRAGA
jgi:chemosensory pili system protein ChpA (sensor histidine kinase/response regulator)